MASKWACSVSFNAIEESRFVCYWQEAREDVLTHQKTAVQIALAAASPFPWISMVLLKSSIVDKCRGPDDELPILFEILSPAGNRYTVIFGEYCIHELNHAWDNAANQNPCHNIDPWPVVVL